MTYDEFVFNTKLVTIIVSDFRIIDIFFGCYAVVDVFIKFRILSNILSETVNTGGLRTTEKCVCNKPLRITQNSIQYTR